MMRFTQILGLCLLVALSGCGLAERVRDRILPADKAEGSSLTGPGTAAAQSVEAIDTTTAAERASALSAGPGEGEDLGRLRVTLGSPTEPGFWLRSALVTEAAQGRVVNDDGLAVAVTLLPGTGGAQLSLAAFRALGLSLTGLPEVQVIKG